MIASRSASLAARNTSETEEPALANAEYIGYSSPNTLVTENEEYQEYMLDWHEGALDILYSEGAIVDDYTDLKELEAESKRSFYHALSNTEENGNLLDYTNALWSEIKIESSIEAWIIIADVLILGGLFGSWLFFFIRRKRREGSYTE